MFSGPQVVLQAIFHASNNQLQSAPRVTSPYTVKSFVKRGLHQSRSALLKHSEPNQRHYIIRPKDRVVSKMAATAESQTKSDFYSTPISHSTTTEYQKTKFMRWLVRGPRRYFNPSGFPPHRRKEGYTCISNCASHADKDKQKKRARPLSGGREMRQRK